MSKIEEVKKQLEKLNLEKDRISSEIKEARSTLLRLESELCYKSFSEFIEKNKEKFISYTDTDDNVYISKTVELVDDLFALGNILLHLKNVIVIHKDGIRYQDHYYLSLHDTIDKDDSLNPENYLKIQNELSIESFLNNKCIDLKEKLKGL